MPVRVNEDTEKRIRLTFPEVVTAALWNKFHAEYARHAIPELMGQVGVNARFYPAYMAGLVILESGTYEDVEGKTHDIKAEGVQVPGYVMTHVALEAQRLLVESLDVPKFSSSPP